MNVLLTDSRLRTCLYVTRSLGEKDVNVFIGENAWLSPHFSDPMKVLTFRSKFNKGFFFYPPPTDTTSFISFMVKLAKYYDALIPINEATIIPICKNLDKFDNVLLPRFNDLEIAIDKKRVMELCTKLRIPIPQTFSPKDKIELKQLSKEVNYPVIIKWRRESMAYPRYKICHSKKSLLHNFVYMQKIQTQPIVQEYINGFGIGFFALFNRNHKLKAYFIHRRIREYPISGGPSACCESFWNKQVLEYGLKLLKALHWRGVAMVEFRYDLTDNIPKVLEINPRFWGSLPLAIMSGVDFPYLLYKLIIEEDFLPVLQYNLNIKCRFTNDFYALLEILKRDKNKFTSSKSMISSLSTKYADFNRKDPVTSMIIIKPILNPIIKIFRKLYLMQ